jgi:formate dehydrogenase iron-sulfur subunit
MSKAMLIDTTRCIGCRGCQVACKSWNALRAAPGGFDGAGATSPLHLDAETFTRVVFREVPAGDGGVKAVYVKRQCMHCVDPACAAACPVGALRKSEDGPVTYDDGKCIGCRYCMVACPYNVPKFQWDARAPYIRKCTFCADRQALGKKPSCVQTCPAQAITFGDRGELLGEAHARIAARPDRYAREVYGERTGGGTSVLYLTAVPIEKLELAHDGFRSDLGDVPQGKATRDWMGNVPLVALTVGGLALGLYHLNQRRDDVTQQDGKKEVSR